MRKKKGKPGDIIINKHMWRATPEEKEAARENLYRLVGVLIQIARRREKEDLAKSGDHQITIT